MERLRQQPDGNELTAAEFNLVKAATEHMDEWIDQMCRCVDELLQAAGYVPADKKEDLPQIHNQAA